MIYVNVEIADNLLIALLNMHCVFSANMSARSTDFGPIMRIVMIYGLKCSEEQIMQMVIINIDNLKAALDCLAMNKK